ncbi:MAG: hypothetical protein Tsb0010_14600 [Parvularculaceae bacterium]
MRRPGLTGPTPFTSGVVRAGSGARKSLNSGPFPQSRRVALAPFVIKMLLTFPLKRSAAAIIESQL